MKRILTNRSSRAIGATDDGGWYRTCIACGGQSLHPLEMFRSAPLVTCADCGLTFAAKRPTDDELAAHYHHYGDWSDSDLTRTRYRELLASFEPYRRSGRIFDMGCGPGYFLDEAKAAGWEPYGSNVGERSLEMCRRRGLEVVEAPIQPDTFPRGHFDVVTAFEVFEHLREPDIELQTLASLVRPGGLLYCTTPNFHALTRRLLGDRWRVIDYPEHLLYFTHASLCTWLSGGGFTPIEVISTGLSPSTLRSAVGRRGERRMLSAPSQLAQDEHLRMVAETGRLMPVIKRGVNRTLTLTRSGDTLKGRFIHEK